MPSMNDQSMLTILAQVFRLLVTDLGGERRFAAAVAKRLASLGALTKGDRRAATGADFSSFDLDTKYGRRVSSTTSEIRSDPRFSVY